MGCRRRVCQVGATMASNTLLSGSAITSPPLEVTSDKVSPAWPSSLTYRNIDGKRVGREPMRGGLRQRSLPYPGPVWCDRAHHSGYRPEVKLDGTRANVAPVRGPGFDRFAEVEPNENARIRI